MQFSRNYRTGISLSIVLAATLAPSAFGIIQIDNYLVDGVPSAEVLNDPGQPYAHAYYYTNVGHEDSDFNSQETAAAIGGYRELEALAFNIAHSGDRESTVGVIGYGPSNQQGLNMSVMKDPLEGDSLDAASITYGSTAQHSTLQLNLDLIGFLDGQPLSTGSFQLNLKSFAAAGAVSGNINVGLMLASKNNVGDLEEQEVVQVLHSTDVPSITWSFTEFSPTILQETDLIQLTLYSGNEGDGFTNVSLVADSFNIVPEPSTYALMLGGAVFLFLIQRKHNSKHS